MVEFFVVVFVVIECKCVDVGFWYEDVGMGCILCCVYLVDVD